METKLHLSPSQILQPMLVGDPNAIGGYAIFIFSSCTLCIHRKNPAATPSVSVSFQKASLSVIATLNMPSAVLCLHAATMGDTPFFLVGCGSPPMLYVYRVNKIDKSVLTVVQDKQVLIIVIIIDDVMIIQKEKV
jgi:hypothetical protein